MTSHLLTSNERDGKTPSRWLVRFRHWRNLPSGSFFLSNRPTLLNVLHACSDEVSQVYLILHASPTLT